MIYLDNIPLSDFGIKVRMDIDEPMLPKTRDRTAQVLGRQGLIDFGADLAELPFNYPADIIGARTSREREILIRKFVAFLLDSKGRPRKLKLMRSHEPDKFYLVRYSGSLDIRKVISLGQFELPLVSYDSIAYADPTAYDEYYEYDTGREYDSGLLFPNPTSFEWIYLTHFSGLHNHSHYETPLILTMEGRVNHPEIYNRTTKQRMRVNVNLSDSEKLYIDGKKCWVIRNDDTNVLPFVKGDFVWLTPGLNELEFIGGNPKALVTYQWLHNF